MEVKLGNERGVSKFRAVDLTQEEVERFMAAEKVVPPDAGMRWSKPEPYRYLCRLPIHVDFARVGTLFLHSNPSLPRRWTLKLIFQSVDVYRWDIHPAPVGHDNPPGCPSGFPSKVPQPEHEHIWREGLDLKCARSLEGLSASDHRAIFTAFCQRTHVRFDPDYVAPQAFEQTQLEL